MIFKNIKAAQNYPILCVCHGRSNIKNQFIRAAKHQGLISISDHPKEFEYAVTQVNEYATNLGKRPEKYEAVFYMTVNINKDSDKAKREADSFIKQYYGINIWEERWGPFGDASIIIERANEYVEAGATTEQVIQWMTDGSAHVMGWELSPFRIGYPAEIAIIDPIEEWKFSESHIKSRSKNSPMLGMTFKGRVVATIKKGEHVHVHNVKTKKW